MSLLETIIALLLGAAAGAIVTAIQKNKAATILLKYGPVVKKAYDIIDPVLDQNLSKWDGSKVDKAFELAINIAGDGVLTAAEVKTLAFAMAQAWLPQKAADKVRKFEEASQTLPALQDAIKVAQKINGVIS